MASALFTFSSFLISLLYFYVHVECKEKRFFFESVSTPPGAEKLNSQTNCSSSFADIAFLLDTSIMDSSKDFSLQKQFILDFINNLQIGPNAAQVSALTYSTNTYIHFFLNDFTSKADVQQGIKNISYHGGNTNTWYAINVLGEYIYKKSRGDRENAPNIVIILTDGNSKHQYDTYLAAEKLRDMGVKIFAIGVGNGISESELFSIGGDREHVFHVQNFGMLGNLLKPLLTLFCDALAGTLCMNKIKNCGAYFHLCSSDLYRLWAEENCPEYCGFCNPVTTPRRPLHFSSTTTIAPVIERTTPLVTMAPSIAPSTTATATPPTTTALPKITTVTQVSSSQTQSSRTTLTITGRPSTSLPTATTAPTPAPIFNGPCVDKIANCPAYGSGVCVSYRGWSTVNCPQFCQVCLGTPPSPKPLTTLPTTTTTMATTTKLTPPPTPKPISEGPCINTINNCHAYGSSVCTRYRDWSAKNCPLFCQFCVGKPSPPTPVQTSQSPVPSTPVPTTTFVTQNYVRCEDKIEACQTYGPDMCVIHRNWAMVQCAKFCLFCNEKDFTTTLFVETDPPSTAGFPSGIIIG